MIVDSNVVYATTINSYFYYYGSYEYFSLRGTIVCKLTYSDSTITKLNTGLVYKLDYGSYNTITIYTI